MDGKKYDDDDDAAIRSSSAIQQHIRHDIQPDSLLLLLTDSQRHGVSHGLRASAAGDSRTVTAQLWHAHEKNGDAQRK